jgi:hypothetical protein
MNRVTNIAHILARITGTIQIILGLIIWIGIADAFIPLHILSGVILVLSLWVLAFVAARTSVNTGLVAFAIAWGLVAVVLGLIHERLIPGQAHWIIQAMHLLVGLVVIGLAERLAILIKQRSKPADNI